MTAWVRSPEELARLGGTIEDLYGVPMDIEWAIAGGRFAILQARPIIVFHAALRDTFSSYPLRNHPEKESQP